jgi:hypothetical protein
MFTFDQTLVVLDRENVTMRLVQKCFLYRALAEIHQFQFSEGGSLELELRYRALQDVRRSAQPGCFFRVEFKTQHAIHSFSIQNCWKAQADIADPVIITNERREGKHRILIAQNGRRDADQSSSHPIIGCALAQ